MGLAKKRAKDSVVNGEIKRLPEGKREETPQPQPAQQPEPLGAHNAPGNADARAAFLEDEGGAPIEPQSAEGKTDESGGTESIPAMSIEQIAEIGTSVIDTAGSFIGPSVTKRKGDFWKLQDTEKATVKEALTPVLKEALQDTKVTPFQLLIGVLLSCYVPRTLYAYSQPAEEKKPEPPKPPEPEAQPPPQPANADGKKTHGW